MKRISPPLQLTLTKTEDQLLTHPPSEYTYRTVPSDLECPICSWPLHHPLTHNVCGHSFCRSCCTSLSNCPMCRESLNSDNLVPCKTRIVLSMIDNLEVTCNKCNGLTKKGLFSVHFNEQCKIGCPNSCGELVVRNLVSQHLEKCCNTVLHCSHQGCQQTFQRKHQLEHETGCYHRIVPCDHCHLYTKRGMLEEHYLVCDVVEIECDLNCGQKFKRKVKHSDTCPEVVVSCLASDIGCNFMEKRRWTNDHEKSCSIFKIRPYVVSLQTTVANLQDILSKTIETIQDHSILQNTWTLSVSEIVDNPKRALLTSDGVAFTTKIPESGVFVIKFKLLSERGNWNTIGVASTESLTTKWLRTSHYVGWHFQGHQDNSYKGILAGYDNQNNIFLNKIKGEKSLPPIQKNDIVTLIFDNHTRTLCFKHNGKLQDIVVIGIPKIDLYFFVGRWNGVVDVCIDDGIYNNQS